MQIKHQLAYDNEQAVYESFYKIQKRFDAIKQRVSDLCEIHAALQQTHHGACQDFVCAFNKLGFTTKGWYPCEIVTGVGVMVLDGVYRSVMASVNKEGTLQQSVYDFFTNGTFNNSEYTMWLQGCEKFLDEFDKFEQEYKEFLNELINL